MKNITNTIETIYNKYDRMIEEAADSYKPLSNKKYHLYTSILKVLDGRISKEEFQNICIICKASAKTKKEVMEVI